MLTLPERPSPLWLELAWQRASERRAVFHSDGSSTYLARAPSGVPVAKALLHLRFDREGRCVGYCKRVRPKLEDFDRVVHQRDELQRRLDGIVAVIEANVHGASFMGAATFNASRLRSVVSAFSRGMRRGRLEGLQIALTAVKRLADGGLP